VNSTQSLAVFETEAAWPFRLHVGQLDACLQFLVHDGSRPRILRIFGSSGSGKTFLVRQLMVEMAADDKESIGLYVDVPASDLESAAILDKLDVLLREPRIATRDAPSFVGKKSARSWLTARRGLSKKVSYGYRATRDLTAQIPLAGPFIKALLPQSVTTEVLAGEGSAPIRFLMKRSRSQRVVLVIDNVQFLPFALREMLDTELAECGEEMRLVLIERVNQRPRLTWAPTIPDAESMDVELGKATAEEVIALVRDVMPEADDIERIAATIFRRSEGNLKSVWFQLRLITARRDHQDALATSSYEDVILTLPALDQTVLRLIVFTIGGLRVQSLVSLLRATNLQPQADAVTSAIADLASLGLLVVNGETADRVRVEHEIVAQVVSEITPEEEKLEFRAQVLAALSAVLEDGTTSDEEFILYDRLLGIATGVELRQSPALLAHVVTFVQLQAQLDRYRYLASLCRDSACWDVLDALPETTVRSLLDSVQKSALFNFGLVATARLLHARDGRTALASLYEAKYLVQLFRYEEAKMALERAGDQDESRSVSFNIMLNLAQDDEAAEIAMGVYAEVSGATGTEQDYVILRNSIHLFQPDDARVVVDAAVDGFAALGRRFGVATALNNRSIVELATGSIDRARSSLDAASRELAALDSPEVYQPLVNLGGLALKEGDIRAARSLLASAADAAPRSLMQDSAMLKLNSLALDICDGGYLGSDAAKRMDDIVREARRTRDLRFIDLVMWFADSLDAIVTGKQPRATAASIRLDEIRNNGRVPIEIFVASSVEGIPIQVPYVLSPQWRH